ncbi:uncharacterized protein LOC118148600 [Callithrix jacchus]
MLHLIGFPTGLPASALNNENKTSSGTIHSFDSQFHIPSVECLQQLLSCFQNILMKRAGVWKSEEADVPVSLVLRCCLRANLPLFVLDQGNSDVCRVTWIISNDYKHFTELPKHTLAKNRTSLES